MTRKVPLADVASINPRSDRMGAGEQISFVGMADLSAETGIAGPGISRQHSEVSRGYTSFRDRDLLVAKITPCFENGKIGQAKLTHRFGVGSTEFHVVRPNTDRIDSRYALHFLRQDWIRRAGELRMTGSAGQRRVPAAFLEQLEIPLPPIEEQRRIAAILDGVETLKSLRRATLASLEHLANSVMERLVENADGVILLGEVADIQGGLQVTSKRSSLPLEVPYLRVANVGRGFIDLTELKSLRVTGAELDRVRLAQGDLLLVEGHGNPAEVGRAALWSGVWPGLVHQNHLIRVRSGGKHYLPEVLEALINSSAGRSHFRRVGKTTSGLNTISTSNVRALPLPRIDMSKQQEFADRISRTRLLATTMKLQAAQIEKLSRTLQSRAFSGQL